MLGIEPPGAPARARDNRKMYSSFFPKAKEKVVLMNDVSLGSTSSSSPQANIRQTKEGLTSPWTKLVRRLSEYMHSRYNTCLRGSLIYFRNDGANERPIINDGVFTSNSSLKRATDREKSTGCDKHRLHCTCCSVAQDWKKGLYAVTCHLLYSLLRGTWP